MEYARDITTGKDVKPDEVDRGTSLICPVCEKWVHYVQKSKDGRKPHFAHNKGEGTIDIECKNYHPSHHTPSTPSIFSDFHQFTENTPSTVPIFSGSHQSTEKKNNYSFQLDIVLSNPILNTPSWYLAIVFAKTAIKYNYVIKQGLIGYSHANSMHPVPVSVDINSQDYQVEIFDNSILKDVITISGLNIESGNLFTHKGDHGRRLSSHKHLYWGEQYFLVWHKDYKVTCPPEIVQRVLIPQDNWECVEIQLPKKPSTVIKNWAYQYLEREIQTPAITLSLVTPPIFKKNEDVVQIKDTDNVVIAVTEPLGNNIQDTLVIKHERFPQRAMDLNDSSPALIDLGHLTPGKTTLSLNSSTKLLILNCVCYQENLRLPAAVFLKFQNDLTLPAYSLSICDSQFMGLSFPTLMNFRILWKSANDLTWQAITITPKKDESQKDLQERAKQAIIELFEKKELFIQLDFGNFGQPLIQQATVSSKSEYRLPNEVIQQLRWLASLDQLGAKCTQQASGEGMRMLKKISRHTEDLNKYIPNFNPYVSAMLEPHLRALAKKIKKERR
ncbi:MAG: hypothetical protein VSS75_018320 [Candidatus Parabeggiatoa sp.]|nr:hypothetical protein [Candidatus Parabeggiatoa sp.]